MICPNCNKVVPDANYKCPYCRKVLKEQGVDPLAFRHEHIHKKSQTFTFFLLAAIVIGVAVLAYFLFVKAEKENVKPSGAKPGVTSPQSSQPQRGNINAGSSKVSGGTGGLGTEEIKGNTDKPDAGEETGDIKGNTGKPETEEIPLTQTGTGESEKSDDPYDWVNKEDPEALAKAYVGGEEIDIEKLLVSGKTTIFDFYSEYCPPCRRISPALAKLDSQRKDIAVVKININRKETKGIDWSSPVAQQYQLRSIPYFIIYDSTGYRTHEGEEAYQKVMDLLNEEKIQQ